MRSSERLRVIGSAIFLMFAQSVFSVVLLFIFRDFELRWMSLVGLVLATFVTAALFDRHSSSDIWLDAAGWRMLGDVLTGVTWATALAVAADLLAQLGNLRHGYGRGIDPDQIGRLFVPAAIEEELLFRGYIFQKLLVINRSFAVISLSALFTAVHLGNTGLTGIAILNIFLAGVVLSLALLWSRSLWFVMAAHLTWNIVIGPILGHEVSGFRPAGTLLTTIDRGPELLTGGNFGVEGSLCVTALAVAVISLLLWRISQNQRKANAVSTIALQGPRELQ